MPLFTGKCLCGNVFYQPDCEPAFTANCHCTNCRDATGAAYSTIWFIKADQLTIEDDTQCFEHLSDRGHEMTKHFWPNCGSQLFGENSAREGMIGIRAGTIDPTDLVQPARNVDVSSKISSTLIGPNLPASNLMPES